MGQITQHVDRNFGRPAAYSALSPYGDAEIPIRTQRRWRADKKWLFHPAKNGVYDPVTYALVVETLLKLRPGAYWYAGGLAQHLNDTEPGLIWDAVTVGRVLSDIADVTTEFLEGQEPIIRRSRDYRGRFYAMTASKEGRKLLVRLRELLRGLSHQIIARERQMEPSPRFESPLNLCLAEMNG